MGLRAGTGPQQAFWGSGRRQQWGGAGATITWRAQVSEAGLGSSCGGETVLMPTVGKAQGPLLGQLATHLCSVSQIMNSLDSSGTPRKGTGAQYLQNFVF